MTWYAASVLISIKPIHHANDPFLVYENIILIEARTSDEAFEKAASFAKEEVDLDDGLRLDNMPAQRSFAGIRKLINISNPADSDLDQDSDPPITGTEITYSLFKVANEQDLELMAKGEPVNVEYLE